MRKPIQSIRRQVQRLADLPRRASSAIRDYIRGHGRAVFAVTPVNFLDHTLAAVAARQIEVDIRPAFSAFAQETLEDQMVADRIHRRDSEAITNRAVRGAAPALAH